jgi:hypothetical protein
MTDWVFPEFPSEGWPALPCDIQMINSLSPDSWRLEAIIRPHHAQPLHAIIPGIDAPDRDVAIALNNEEPGENAIDDSLPIIDELVAETDAAPDGGKDVREDVDLKKRVLSVEHPDPDFTRIGWQILSTIRGLASQAEWESSWPTAIEQVFKIGGQIWYEHQLVNQDGAVEDGGKAAQEQKN